MNIKDPVRYAQQAVDACRELYGADLVSVTLYGSAAGGDFDPLRSDINLLIVLRSMDAGLIAKSALIWKKLRRRRFGIPLFMDKEYIAASVDSYPMEFMDMKERRVVLFGEDVLETISCEPEHLRLQIERELKGKWLHLMQGFILAHKNSAMIRNLAQLSLRDFTPIFRALCTLRGEKPPTDRKSLSDKIETLCSLEGKPLQGMRDGCVKGRLLNGDLVQRFIDYARAIKKIIDSIENQ